MSKKDKAKKLEQEILRATKATQQPVYELWVSEGYTELGHNSFKDWAKANQEKFNRSYDSINNDLHAARITVDMCGKDNIGKFSTYALLPMKKLSAHDRETVYELAQNDLDVSEIKGRDLTHKRVKEYMKLLDSSAPDKPAENIQHDANKEEAKPHLSPEQQKRKRSFSSVLNSSDSPYFAKRVCIAISNTIPKKSTLRICRELLELHGYKDTANSIKKAIRKLKK